MERCPGCGAAFAPESGTTHPYMLSSPACWSRFGEVMAREYGEPALMATHRLSVDSYAAQHPGGSDRRAIQSVGLHLARLMIQLDDPLPARETNDVMRALGRHKATLPPLSPPPAFYAVTVADVAAAATIEQHVAAVRRWAAATWAAWSAHHAFIRQWTNARRGRHPAD